MGKLRNVSLYAVGAAIVVFVLSFLILGANLQTAMIWATGFATFAFLLAAHPA